MAKKLSELKPTDEVVVKLGAKQDAKDGEIVTIEQEKQVIMTKAAFDSIELRGDKGNYSPTLNRTVALAGTPKYKKPEDTMAGEIKEMSGVEALTDEVTAPVA